MENKRLLFMINTLNIGGAETGLVDLVNQLSDDGHKVDILLTLNAGDLRSSLSDDIKVHSILDKKRIFKSLFGAALISLSLIGIPLYRLFYRESYDGVISYLEGFPTLFASRLNGKRKIASVRVGMKNHQTILDKLPWGRSMQKNAYLRYNAVHCVSASTLEEFVELYPEVADRSLSITTGFDIEAIQTKADETFTWNNDKINIVTVGRIESQKGYHLQFEAIDKLSQTRNDFVLHIVGNEKTDYAKELLANPKYSNLVDAGFIVLHGVQNNPYKFMKQADFMLNTSYYEGFPRVMNEALILNKFCVISDISSNLEAFEGNEAIFVPLDSTAFAQAINKTLDEKPYIDYQTKAQVKTKKQFVEEFLNLIGGSAHV